MKNEVKAHASAGAAYIRIPPRYSESLTTSTSHMRAVPDPPLALVLIGQVRAKYVLSPANVVPIDSASLIYIEGRHDQ